MIQIPALPEFPAFDDAHICGWRPKTYPKKLGVYLLYTCLWMPLKHGARRGYKDLTEDRRGIVAKNCFNGETRHWYCFGGTGWGKSSLLKEAIADIMPDVLAGKKSMLVMDGTELCDEILAQLNLTDEQTRKHVVFIDLAKPGGRNDVGCMPRLGLMEMSDGSETEDEYVDLTARIGIFEMLFEGLLEAEITPPMKAMMSYSAQTMAYLDDPTANDLLALLTRPLAFISKMENLPENVLKYWRREIRTRPIKQNGEVIGEEEMINETADALARRVDMVLGNPIIKRLLVNRHPTVNLAGRLNEGGVLILVATRQGKIGPTQARLVGRFILSMLLRAVGARNSLGKIVKTVAAVDEFHRYLLAGKDDSLLNLLAEARKFGVSIWLLHQEERQLSPAMLNSLLNNCMIITAGGMSRPMASALSDKIGIEILDKGTKNARPSIELTKLKPRSFVASVREKPPVVIQSKPDALGDRYTRLPRKPKSPKVVDKRALFVMRAVKRTNEIMRQEYAHPPRPAANDDAPKFRELEAI